MSLLTDYEGFMKSVSSFRIHCLYCKFVFGVKQNPPKSILDAQPTPFYYLFF